jgi:beta-xylosidase
MKNGYILLFSLLLCNLLTVEGQTVAAIEKQPVADQGNGFYLNPVIPGNYGDPSPLVVGNDYYMAFSRANGFIIWHSRDLVNWSPLVKHTFTGDYSMIWAVDLQYFNGRFHLYMPINNYPGKNQKGFGNFVTISEKAEGPWSEPIDLELPMLDLPGYSAIDPGFIQTPEGKKYLYVSDGYYVKLNDDGTKAVSSPVRAYEGWQYPEEWNVECMCLESPKLFIKEGFYYLVSAQGGTSGPSTAHMTVVARSQSPEGPWINSPYNPITHTYSNDEKWWHQGHGTIFEAADGTWWTVYHARLHDYTEIGRQVLLMPVEWTEDGWPVIKEGIPSSALIPMPAGENIGGGLPLSDDFSSTSPGIQWDIPKNMASLIKTGAGELAMDATGYDHRTGTFISTGAVNRSFEVTVEVTCSGKDVWGGIDLGTDGVMTNGLITTFSEAADWRKIGSEIALGHKGRVFLKIRNFRKDLSFYYSEDGVRWISFGKGLRPGNSYSIRLFAWGNGAVRFSDFRYVGLE